ncbi:Serine-threonine/tyrosine-protein kinase, catalytic domain [Sesbania bispinosa]|nr:Serine-threonine/tyrosine-protein kinase, catalytic domain [Sesbania bispinosa]
MTNDEEGEEEGDQPRNLIIRVGGSGIAYIDPFELRNGAQIYSSSERMSKNFGEEEEFMNEIELLCQLRHPSLISLMGFCFHKYDMISVYKYMPMAAEGCGN